MNHEDITELFIRGSEIDRRLPNTARPARLKAQALPYHHDQKDMNGWGTERLEEERQAFWDARSTRLQAQDVSEWERCNDLIKHVERERDRRCLWAWAKAKSHTGMSFSRWCRDVEGIHRNYGTECKDRAINQICECFSRSASISVMEAPEATLQEEPEIGHIPVNIEEPRRFAWMAPGAFSATVDLAAQDFSWAEKMNERRRQREKRAAA